MSCQKPSKTILEREERLAVYMRENLKRRKQQQRQRQVNVNLEQKQDYDKEKQ